MTRDVAVERDLMHPVAATASGLGMTARRQGCPQAVWARQRPTLDWGGRPGWRRKMPRFPAVRGPARTPYNWGTDGRGPSLTPCRIQHRTTLTLADSR